MPFHAVKFAVFDTISPLIRSIPPLEPFVTVVAGLLAGVAAAVASQPGKG